MPTCCVHISSFLTWCFCFATTITQSYLIGDFRATAKPAVTSFYQGILQIAVGLYHAGNENWRGSLMLLGEGISKLNYYQPSYFGINVDKLLIESSELLKYLQQSGPEKIVYFVRSLQNQNGKYPQILKLKD